MKAALQSLLSEAGVPGASMAVVGPDGVTACAAGYTNLETAAEVNADTIFDAASLSKPVFAYAVLQLVDAGLLSLDTRLSDWVPGYVTNDPQASLVTASHALAHSSGLPNWRSDEFPLRTYHPPGTAFRYSGEGFTWLQRVVEAITGQPLETLARRLVFEPLGMTTSSYVWQRSFEANYASPHSAAQEVGPKRKPADAMSAYSLHTTAADYARFIQAVLTGAGLQPGTAALWLTPQVPLDAPGVAWGLGWGLEPDRGTFFQWGDNDQGRHKAFAIGSISRQVAVVVFTNGFHGMSIVPDLIEDVLPGHHPCFDWLGYKWHARLA